MLRTLAVSITMPICGKAWRKRLAIDKPSSSGKFKSSTTTSGTAMVSAWFNSWPSPTPRTSNPAWLNWSCKASRKAMLSSTKRTALADGIMGVRNVI